MAALAAERNTQQKADVSRSPLSWPQGVNTCFKGGLIVLNAAGFAEPATTAAAKVAIGRCQKTSINAGSAGDTNVEVEEGIFKWGNSGGDLVVAADRGLSVYMTDDQTVNHTATGKSIAGKCVQIDTDGVWVKTSL